MSGNFDGALNLLQDQVVEKAADMAENHTGIDIKSMADVWEEFRSMDPAGIAQLLGENVMKRLQLGKNAVSKEVSKKLDSYGIKISASDIQEIVQKTEAADINGALLGLCQAALPDIAKMENKIMCAAGDAAEDAAKKVLGDLEKRVEGSIKDPQLKATYRVASNALADQAGQANPQEILDGLMGLESFDPETIFSELGDSMLNNLLTIDNELVEELVLGMQLDFATDLEALGQAMEDLNNVFVFIIDQLQLDM
jgi:hypothetical protein